VKNLTHLHEFHIVNRMGRFKEGQPTVTVKERRGHNRVIRNIYNEPAANLQIPVNTEALLDFLHNNPSTLSKKERSPKKS
jgi:hypothetical protein